jgi:probable HAF family extracellular repeat protein
MINDDGLVVGDGQDFFFIWNSQTGDLSRIYPPPNGRISTATYSGAAAGWYFGGRRGAFLTWNGETQDFSANVQTLPLGVNASGAVVGLFQPNGPHAFFYYGGSMQDLGGLGGEGGRAWAINSSGETTGALCSRDHCWGDPSYWHAFHYDGQVVQDLGVLGPTPSGFESSEGLAINELGHIAGISTSNDGRYHLFLWDGSMQDLGTSAGQRSIADVKAISEQPEAIVGTIGPESDAHAFIYRDGAIQDLNDLVASPPMALWHANGVNNNGQIVGVGGEPGGAHRRGFLLTPRGNPMRRHR